MTKTKSKLILLSTFLIAFLLLSSFSLVYAQDNGADEEDEEDETEDEAINNLAGETAQKNKAFTWLSNQVKIAWPKSVEEISFALLALTADSKSRADGKSALLAKNPGKTGSNIKDSALALLALNNIGEDTDYIEEWLLSKQQPFKTSNLEWRIQLDVVGKTECDVSYGGKVDAIKLNEDKTLEITSPSAIPNCLSVVDDFWLKISNTADGGKCLEKTYSINCGERVRASLYFKKESVYFVPSQTLHEEYPELKIESICLADSSGCNYGANLWATYALAKAGSDEVNILLPYLISLEESEENYLPYSFLYLLTENDDYAERLLNQQEKKGYWYSTKYGKWYSTALAYMALKDYYAEANITKAKKYVLGYQSTIGSWDNNILDTAFLSYALWPSGYAGVVEGNLCTDEGHECKIICDSDDEEKVDEYSYFCGDNVCCREKEYSPECTTTDDCLKAECDRFTLPSDCTCEYNIEKKCDDGCDNDADNLIDDDDPDCQIPECVREGYVCCADYEWGHKSQYDYSCEGGVCAEECEREREICDDGVDNDNDLLVDCDDDDCELSEHCQKTSLLWFILPILIVILAAVYVYFNKKKGFNIIVFVKKQIAKFKKPKPGQPVPPAQAGARMPVKPVVGSRVTRIRPRSRIRPIRRGERSETETELERTMKKIREMGKGKKK